MESPRPAQRYDEVSVEEHSPGHHDERPVRELEGAAPPVVPPETRPMGETPEEGLQRWCSGYEVTATTPQHLLPLQGYSVVCLVDDSYSMTMKVYDRQGSRWSQAKRALGTIASAVRCAKVPEGVSVHFLNRGESGCGGVRDLKSDAALVDLLDEPPQGSTPMAARLRAVIARTLAARERGGAAGSETSPSSNPLNQLGDLPPLKPTLLVILTDGEPDEGPLAVEQLLEETERCHPGCFVVHFFALTRDARDAGWLDRFKTARFPHVTVSDEYCTAQEAVTKKPCQPVVTKQQQDALRPAITEADWVAAGLRHAMSRGKLQRSVFNVQKERMPCCTVM
eukprot:TRINITY_DN16057_c0_g1_i2.p1 TRINITY_DN16057_c0_g1~~TRINITY_DN16057_c0_g1_i2.p1  ORF type:complete len:338 (+),score=121.22 TRINITY_DN16057_c0_g1_i2:34-1047(+)